MCRFSESVIWGWFWLGLNKIKELIIQSLIRREHTLVYVPSVLFNQETGLGQYLHHAMHTVLWQLLDFTHYK